MGEPQKRRLHVPRLFLTGSHSRTKKQRLKKATRNYLRIWTFEKLLHSNSVASSDFRHAHCSHPLFASFGVKHSSTSLLSFYFPQMPSGHGKKGTLSRWLSLKGNPSPQKKESGKQEATHWAAGFLRVAFTSPLGSPYFGI